MGKRMANPKGPPLFQNHRHKWCGWVGKKKNDLGRMTRRDKMQERRCREKAIKKMRTKTRFPYSTSDLLQKGSHDIIM